MATGDFPVPSTVLYGFKDSLGSTFIGYALSTTLYGVSNVQTYLYYRNYPGDRLVLKLMVGLLWILDTLTTVLISESVYTYLVLNLNNLIADSVIPWSYGAEFLVVVLIILISQIFFAVQIWLVSNNKKIIVGPIILLSLASFACGIVATYDLFTSTSAVVVSAPHELIVGSLTQGLAAICDCLITGALIYYLHSRRTGIRSTEVMIDKLIMYGVSRGTLTAICQTMFLILLQGIPYKGASFWQPFHQVSGKLYFNSILASLNVRTSIGGPHVSTSTGMGSLQFTQPNTLYSVRNVLGLQSADPERHMKNIVISRDIQQETDMSFPMTTRSSVHHDEFKSASLNGNVLHVGI
ncbi:hypothetical protein C8J56DRAFT_975834, partial [Mycena floridula]